MPSRNPITWDEYEGRVSADGGSATSSQLAEDQALLEDDGDEPLDGFLRQDRRRSSIPAHLSQIADIGGVNSIRRFARSWQRAAAFPEVIPRKPSFVFDAATATADPAAEDILYGRSHVEFHTPTTGLLRQHLESSPPNRGSTSAQGGSSNTFDDGSTIREGIRERENKALDTELAAGIHGPTPSGSIFSNPPYLATPSIIGSYGSIRGSIYGTVGGGSIRSARPSVVVRVPGWDQDEDAAHGEHEPILVKEVRQGNKVVLTVEGQSTLPQSVFNSINAIIGVGILSLPLAFKISGWIIGLLLLTLNASVTGYTGRLLARCMDFDPSLITYSDLAFVSFGTRARVVVSALFTLELVAACVALSILFADSLDLLLPGFATVNTWKTVCAVLVLFLNAMPLRFLSYTSVIGIFSTFCIVCIVILDGLIKEHAPGSLREPSDTNLLPPNWLAVPLAYGLLASPWGAHSIFPSIYRDMRHPHKWTKAVNVTFSFSYILDMTLAVIGILMFGDGIQDAITSNILRMSGYPQAMTVFMCIFVAIIPLTKIPLNARPLITTADVLCGVHEPLAPHPNGTPRNNVAWSMTRAGIRVLVVFVLLIISIAFPAFDSVCAFLGAALCTLISIILPVSFYLKLYWSEIPYTERVLLFTILVVFSIFGTFGTIWTFLPKELYDA